MSATIGLSVVGVDLGVAALKESFVKQFPILQQWKHRLCKRQAHGIGQSAVTCRLLSRIGFPYSSMCILDNH